MSKSLGNTVDPNQVCDTLGADILRLWVASVDYQDDHPHFRQYFEANYGSVSKNPQHAAVSARQFV